MRVHSSMIDKDLRLPGRLIKLLARPHVATARLINFMGRFAEGRALPGFRSEEIEVPRSTGEGTIRARLFAPFETSEPLPLFLYCHSGGYIMGSPETTLPIYEKFLKAYPAILIVPAYRLSLEAPYPAALDDCYDTLLWMQQEAERLGGRRDRIVVGGHSAGGGLTAAITLRARARQDVKIALQLPIYPMIDDRMETPSMKDNNAPVWNLACNRIAWERYLGGLFKSDNVPEEAAPARATDLAGLPPAISFIGSLDPFRDETVTYMKRLEEAGVPVTFREFEGGYHAYELVAPKARLSREADDFLYTAYAEALDDLNEKDEEAMADGEPEV